MPGGRPTDDPKETLVAVRLADRQLRVLKARAKREDVALSEALRRCIEEWATGARQQPAAKRPRPDRSRQTKPTTATTTRRTKVAPPAAAMPATRADEIDIETFARTVREIARTIPAERTRDGLAHGRFGSRKVFLAALRRQLGADPRFARMPRTAIDDLLVGANRAGLLELGRADLVAAMDPVEVRDSEINTPIARYHFLIDD